MLAQVVSKIWPCVLRCEIEPCYYAVCQKSSDAWLGLKLPLKCVCVLLHSCHNYRSFEKTTYDVISWVVYIPGPIIMCFYGSSINASMNLQRSGGTSSMRTWMLFTSWKHIIAAWPECTCFLCVVVVKRRKEICSTIPSGWLHIWWRFKTLSSLRNISAASYWLREFTLDTKVIALNVALALMWLRFKLCLVD